MSADWDLFRALYESSDCPNWQTNARPDIRELASRAGVAYSTAWTKLREWRRTGFLQAPNFFPHPNLFGVGLEIHLVRHSEPAARGPFLDQLELVDGMFLAHPVMGDETMIITIADSDTSRARRRANVARIPGVASVTPCQKVWLPPPAGELSLADLRLIAALRETPDASFGALARRLGVSRQTVSRQFRALSESYRMLTGRTELFSRFPETVAVFNLELDPDADAHRLGEEIRSTIPGLLEVAGIVHPPFAEPRRLFFSKAMPNAAQVEELTARLRRFAGVVGATAHIPGSERSYSEWFDNRIAQELGIPRKKSARSVSRSESLRPSPLLWGARS